MQQNYLSVFVNARGNIVIVSGIPVDDPLNQVTQESIEISPDDIEMLAHYLISLDEKLKRDK